MNRILLVINSVVLAVVLAIVVTLIVQMTGLADQVDALPTMQVIETLHTTDRLLTDKLTSTQQTAAQLDKRVASLTQRVKVLPTMEVIAGLQKKLAEAAEQVTSLSHQAEQLSRTAKAMDAAHAKLQMQLAKLDRQVNGGMVDLSGSWQLHNKPTPNLISVSMMRLEPGRYKMVTGANAGGEYKIEDGQLVMTKPGSVAYKGFVWKIKDSNTLVLLTTQYHGSVLKRVEAN